MSFYSSLICERDRIEEIIDARTSDAIALATRFNAPIFTYENILDKAGIFLKAKEESTDSVNKFEVEELLPEISEDVSLKETSIQKLHNKLDEAVVNEDYELAAKLRDEISKRQKK